MVYCGRLVYINLETLAPRWQVGCFVQCDILIFKSCLKKKTGYAKPAQLPGWQVCVHVCMCLLLETLETVSQKQNNTKNILYNYVNMLNTYFFIYAQITVPLFLRRWETWKEDDVMRTVQSQRQEDDFLVDLVTHSRIVAVCTGLLITRVYGHVRGWRSRILLQVNSDGPVRTHSKARQQGKAKAQWNQNGCIHVLIHPHSWV